jgi:hypothetical protein
MVCALFGTTLSLRAADITWANPSGGDWNTAASWSPSQVPGPADKAILALGVTATVDADATVGSLDLSNGALSGSGNLTVNGTLNWTGGSMNGAGATTVASGGSLVIGGASDKVFSQRTINTPGRWPGAARASSTAGTGRRSTICQAACSTCRVIRPGFTIRAATRRW